MSAVQRKSIEKLDNAANSPVVDEKHVDSEIASVSVDADSADGDEALQLVGRERTAQFSDEYNRKLRRKLVRSPSALVVRSPSHRVPRRTGSSLRYVQPCTLLNSCTSLPAKIPD